MNVKRVAIGEASDHDLRQFAVISLGLDVPPRETREKLIARIKATYTADEIVLPKATDMRERLDEVARTTRPVPEEQRDPEAPDEVEVRIKVHTAQNDAKPVWVSVNGRGLWVPRGESVWLKERYVAVLEQAEQLVYPEYDMSLNGGLGGLGEPSAVKLYPFSYV